MKRCTSCNVAKEWAAFHKRAASKDGLNERCMDCVKEYLRYYRYGITPEQFDTMYEEQNGKCAVCRESEAAAVDHDHSTGMIRGLLCHNCNRGIGLLGDSKERLASALNYLTGESTNE